MVTRDRSELYRYPFNNRDLKTKLCGAFVTMVQAADLWKSNDPADGLYGPVIPVSLALARDEDANDDNKRSTNATYSAAILRLTQSHGPGIHGESNR